MILNDAITVGRFNEFSTGLLLDVYTQAPGRLRRSVEGLKEDELSVFPFADKWSIKEIVFHLLDSELIGSVRFRQTITQSDRHFPFYNQDIWTKQLEYQQRDIYELEEALDMFMLLRKNNYRLLQSARDNQWNLTGYHPERGELTLRQLLELYSDHGERHIDQIIARRNLFGKPVDMEVILTKRLY
jgi:hypothetical protein